jgi:RsiW-degrading membrane proteinase PrsW (M82 family)
MEYLNNLSILIPSLIAFVLYYFFRSRKADFSGKLLIKSFLWGMASIVLVIVVQYLAAYFDLDNLKNLRRLLFYTVAVVGFFSELAKYFFLKVICYPDKNFRTPLDGIVFSIMVAMGFATTNNILTLINIPHLQVDLVNALSSGPANIIFGGLMGFFLGLGKLRKMRWIDSMTGLSAAVLFHAIYAFTLITADYKLLAAFFIGSGIILASLILAASRIHKDARMNEGF